MPEQTVCPFCRREGLVRRERVITSASSVTQYFCGGCLKEWTRPDPHEATTARNGDRST